MIQLLLDTACERGVVAISNGDFVVASRYLNERLKHAEELPAAIQACLDEVNLSMNDLARIVVGKGPGSFVGVRVAIAHAKGMGFALQIPVVGVCTLSAIRGLGSETVYIDARRSEYYVLEGEYLRTISYDALNDLSGDKITAKGPTAEGLLAICPEDDFADEILTLTPGYIRDPDAKRYT